MLTTLETPFKGARRKQWKIIRLNSSIMIVIRHRSHLGLGLANPYHLHQAYGSLVDQQNE